MGHYLVAKITIHDRATYANYEAGFMDIFAATNGKLLAVDEDEEVLEGSWSATRTVLVEFPSREEAKAWYDSDAYQTLAQHRFASSAADIILIQGLDGGPG
jgi:uncharacterized protein (DUF1330 family)